MTAWYTHPPPLLGTHRHQWILQNQCPLAWVPLVWEPQAWVWLARAPPVPAPLERVFLGSALMGPVSPLSASLVWGPLVQAPPAWDPGVWWPPHPVLPLVCWSSIMKPECPGLCPPSRRWTKEGPDSLESLDLWSAAWPDHAEILSPPSVWKEKHVTIIHTLCCDSHPNPPIPIYLSLNNQAHGQKLSLRLLWAQATCQSSFIYSISM